MILISDMITLPNSEGKVNTFEKKDISYIGISFLISY